MENCFLNCFCFCFEGWECWCWGWWRLWWRLWSICWHSKYTTSIIDIKLCTKVYLLGCCNELVSQSKPNTFLSIFCRKPCIVRIVLGVRRTDTIIISTILSYKDYWILFGIIRIFSLRLSSEMRNLSLNYGVLVSWR